MKHEQWPKPGSATAAEVERRIAVAVHSEHAAGSLERIDAVLTAIQAEREACAQACDARFFASAAAKDIRARGNKTLRS